MLVKNKDTTDSCFKKRKFKVQWQYKMNASGLIFIDEKKSHATQCNTFPKTVKLPCLFQEIIREGIYM